MIILTVIITIECSKDAIGQSDRIGLRRLRERAEIAAPPAKDVADYPVAVIAALVHGFGQIHEPPHQLQRLGGIDLRDLIDNRTALRFEIGSEIAHLAPIREGARTGDLGEPLAHLRRHGLWRLMGGELQPQSPLRRRITLGDIHQQLGQALRAKRFEVFGVQCRFRSHVDGASSDEMVERLDRFNCCEQTLGTQRVQIILNRSGGLFNRRRIVFTAGTGASRPRRDAAPRFPSV